MERETKAIEIGPGPGILTRALLEANIDVTAVERDDRFVERLVDYKNVAENLHSGKLEVVGEDIPKFDPSPGSISLTKLQRWLAISLTIFPRQLSCGSYPI